MEATAQTAVTVWKTGSSKQHWKVLMEKSVLPGSVHSSQTVTSSQCRPSHLYHVSCDVSLTLTETSLWMIFLLYLSTAGL